VRNDYTQYFEEHPEELQPFPQQAIKAMQDGAAHLGAPSGTDVDLKREFMPAGQGVGGIHELVPAGELVLRFVLEAEEALDRVAKLRV